MIGKLTRVSRGRKNWLVRTEDKPIEISTNNFLKIVDSLFPPTEASVSTVQDKEVTQTTTGTPKSIEVQIEGLPIRGIIDTGSISRYLVELHSKKLLQLVELKGSSLNHLIQPLVVMGTNH